MNKKEIKANAKIKLAKWEKLLILQNKNLESLNKSNFNESQKAFLRNDLNKLISEAKSEIKKWGNK